ncbi:MAG: hypothetical protein LUI60_06120 [Clostridia bacterium]|nr:hypothetical protein [Clostridia bacterium]
MWNKESALRMLENYSIDDKQGIQAAIDYDKYINSEILGCDLCGGYAPFCSFCALHSQRICAKMYAEYRTRYKGGRLPMLGGCSYKNEAAVQQAIDVKKYCDSQMQNTDLCKNFAPFCDICVINSKTPCADAYLKYIKQFERIKVGTMRCKKKNTD